MRKHLLFIVCMMSCATLLHAQKKDPAQHEFDEMRYYDAIQLSLRQDTTKPVVIGRIANGYRLIKQYEPALRWYRKYMNIGAPTAADYLHYAGVLANNGSYDEAQLAYLKYLTLEKNEPVVIDFAAIKGLQTDSVGYEISYLSLNTNYDEFSPIPFRNGLIFTSNRRPGNYSKRSFEWDNKPFTDLWFVPSTQQLSKIRVDSVLYRALYRQNRKISSEDTPPTANDSKTLGNFAIPFIKDTLRRNRPELLDKKLRSKYHDGPATMNAAQNLLAYSTNYDGQSEFSTDGVNRLQLYTVTYTKGEWGAKQAFPHNGKEYSTAHPAFNAAGDTMYFASTRPGGYGGSDIYMSVHTINGWSSPRNLGPSVNSAADEKFPYLSASGVLYFSSDGHTGLGGLDIFRINLQMGMPTGLPKNLGAPFNSSKDDFGIILNEPNNTGYFSSNRLFSDDIFYFEKKTGRF